jgi:hypothetical protein
MKRIFLAAICTLTALSAYGQAQTAPPGERFAGISSYTVQAFDRRIVGLYVNYEGPPNGPRWTNVDDLAEKFVESFKLPSTANWLLDRSEARRGLQCHGFQVFTLISGDRATLMLIEPEWVQTQKTRLAAYEEQKRREFKP